MGFTSGLQVSCSSFSSSNHGFEPGRVREYWRVSHHACPQADQGHQHGRTPWCVPDGIHSYQAVGQSTPCL